jgi:hypothetical protein
MLLSKVPTLHTFGSKSVEFFHLLNYISDKRDWKLTTNEDFEQVFGSIKQSLENTNGLIFSHTNLELYSTFYKFLSGKVGSSKAMKFAELGQIPQSENLYFFEKEPCMKCFEGTSERFLR